jgi:hypothetical protein
MQSARYSCRILMKLEFSWQIFEKRSLNIKFYQNPSYGIRVVPCEQTDMTKVAFRSFANSPKNEVEPEREQKYAACTWHTE